MNDVTKKLTKAIAENLTIEDGQAEVDEAVFWNNAPEGVTPESAKTLRDYESDYINASAQALGDVSKEYLQANEDTDMISGAFSMGQGVDVNHSFHKNTDDGEWKAVCSVDRELSGEDVLGKIQDTIAASLND